VIEDAAWSGVLSCWLSVWTSSCPRERKSARQLSLLVPVLLCACSMLLQPRLVACACCCAAGGTWKRS
jgi:hypothetical protein